MPASSTAIRTNTAFGELLAVLVLLHGVLTAEEMAGTFEFI
jgi:hypothetical protein